jgi:hypothetical protein
MNPDDSIPSSYLCLLPHHAEELFCVGPVVLPGEAGPAFPEESTLTGGYALAFASVGDALNARVALTAMALSRTQQETPTNGICAWFRIGELEALVKLVSGALGSWLRIQEVLPSNVVFGDEIPETSGARGPNGLETPGTSGPSLLTDVDKTAAPFIWVAAQANRERGTQALGQLFSRIAVLAEDTAERRPTSAGNYQLTFRTPAFYHDEALDILSELSAVRVFDGVPDASFNGGTQPFRQVTASWGRDDVYAVDITPSHEHFSSLLDSLTPGIRGWDLSLSHAISQKRAPRRNAPDPSGPPEALTASALWQMGTKVHGAVATDYFRRFGVNLGWAPPALRFIERSPLPRDNGAPLLLFLMENKSGKAVGFQRIRLDTHGRKLVPFYGEEMPPVTGTLGKLKARCVLTTVLEDAVALQRLTLNAAIVVPLHSGFEAVPLDEGATEFSVYLPAHSPEWAEPALRFAHAAIEAGASVRVIEPAPEAVRTLITASNPDAQIFWWKLLKGRSSLDAALEHEIPLS